MSRGELSSSLSAVPELQHLIQVVETYRAPTHEEDILHVGTTFAFAELVVSRLKNISPNHDQNRTGGVLAVGKTGDNDYLVLGQVGEINNTPDRSAADKFRKYTNVVLGKIGILLQYPEFRSSQVNKLLPALFRLVTEKIEIPGGAMRYGTNMDEILGFSGFGSPAEDDCVCLATKVIMGDLSIEEALEQAKQTNNLIYPQVADYLLGWTEEVPVVTRS